MMERVKEDNIILSFRNHDKRLRDISTGHHKGILELKFKKIKTVFMLK